ncbi:uncharacterized protein UTRI_02480 [Ustilago trichophora]|uniref:Zn(2)-C6 fungal-type domain-containing protein n=1 Tax=Ustilago trichophora TaxID=86804 RepID=A0A5C3E663_9BASI|nr:uncharacterized protein UTRI_02480 [Ustilago trichophora]
MSNNAAAREPVPRPVLFQEASTSDAGSEPSIPLAHSHHPKGRQPQRCRQRPRATAKEELKIYKTISRVHRACNACRKQKARCDGPENPPCRRCSRSASSASLRNRPRTLDVDYRCQDAAGSSDRIRALEAQMSGMQSMISELVASIKANTNAITAPPSSLHRLTIRLTRQQLYSVTPFIQSFQKRPHHPHANTQSTASATPHAPPCIIALPACLLALHRRLAEISPDANRLPQRPPTLTLPARSAATAALHQLDAHACWLPSQQPSFQTAYGHPPTKQTILCYSSNPSSNTCQCITPFDMWNTGMHASTSSQSMDGHPRRRICQARFEQDDRVGLRSHGSTNSLGLFFLSHGCRAAATAGAPLVGHRPHPPGHPPASRSTSRRRWTSSDRAGSHSHSIEQNLTPSDGPTAGEDGDARETDISNEQLSAPIEALRAAGDMAATPSLQLVDEGGKRTTFGQQDDDSAILLVSHRAREGGAIRMPILPVQQAALVLVLKAKAALLDPTPQLLPLPTRHQRQFDPLPIRSSQQHQQHRSIRSNGSARSGVPKFISIFHLEDESMTTEEAYHYVRTTSYFLFNVMLAIGAKAKRNAKDTMFSPVAGKAAVQAMVLLAAYSENGWLPLGLSFVWHKSWDWIDRSRSSCRLFRIWIHSTSATSAAAQTLDFLPQFATGFQLYRFPTDVNSVGGESVDGKTGGPANAAGANAVAAVAAASYGAGRPAMLSNIITLELLIIRETHYDAMAPYDQPVDARMLSKMRKVTEELNEWHHAELYLSCTALRGIRDANDADQMGPGRRNSSFSDSCGRYLLEYLCQLERVDTYGIFSNAERLASRLAEVPAGKYARSGNWTLRRLGAEATRPGAITPAEIKTGGPSDSGISLLYKLLQEYQNGEGWQAWRTNASLWRWKQVADDRLSSPSVGGGIAGMFGGVGQGGSGAMSPYKAGGLGGLFSQEAASAESTTAQHGGGAFGGDSAGNVNNSNHPIQLPLWMQESTGTSSADLGAFGDAPPAATSPSATRSWTHNDHYQSPLPHHNSTSSYTSPTYQPPRNPVSLLPPPHRPSPAQPSGSGGGQMAGVHGFRAAAGGSGTNFDSVLSDLGLPLDGLDGLFVDLPINAPTGQSNYSV